MSLKIIIINLLNQNKMKQTAVEWLETAIALYVERCDLQKEFEKAKEMEREQIVKAYEKGEFNSGCNESSEQYYVKTYK